MARPTPPAMALPADRIAAWRLKRQLLTAGTAVRGCPFDALRTPVRRRPCPRVGPGLRP